PFTFDYKLDGNNVTFFTQGDDMATLLACTPFYAGAQPLPGQHTQEYDAARARKVDEIIGLSDTLAADALKLKPDVDALRKGLLDYLTVCLKEEPKASTYARESAGEVLRLYTLEAVTEAEYQSIDTTSSNPFTHSYLQYLKTAKAVELGALYLQDINSIVAFAAMGLDGLHGTQKAKLADANKKLDSAMGKFNGMTGQIGKVMSGMRQVNYGFKQLATGDYHYARAAVKFMRDSLPQLKAAAENIKPNQYMDTAAVALTKSYLTKYDHFSAAFQKYLDAVPSSELLPIASLGSDAPGCAFADQPGEYGTAYVSMTEPAKDPGKPKDGWLATGWKGIKDVVHGTQSVIGVGLDVAGTGVKNLSRIGTGLYYGNTMKEIWTDMKTNVKQIEKNWRENKSGAETMRTANQYINAIDDGATWVASSGAEKVFGEGWTSWGVGKVAGATAGIFTGLGKGITLVGNRDAQASDYVIGAVEIGSAFIGGSKLILRGNQLPEFLTGLGKGSWLSSKGAWNAVANMAGKMEKSEIDAALKTTLKLGTQTTGLETRQAINQAMLAAIEKSNQALKAEMATIIEKGVKAGWANFNATLHDSLNDFVRKEFTNNIQGVAKAIATALGKDATDYADNVIAQWAEDVLKDLVDKAMAEAPLAAELKGVWTGTTTFTSITVPESNAKAGGEGCDFSAIIKALKDKPLATTMRLD
ncbi:MAG TPA: hypothetical protein VGM23_00310, partial [Armatimonadota bacterium]